MTEHPFGATSVTDRFAASARHPLPVLTSSRDRGLETASQKRPTVSSRTLHRCHSCRVRSDERSRMAFTALQRGKTPLEGVASALLSHLLSTWWVCHSAHCRGSLMPVPLEVWMRRSPLILALVLTATSSLAQTQTPTPSPTTSQPTTATPSSQSVAAAQAAAPPAALEEETAAPAQNARLAPGGVVAGGSSFPLGLQLTLDNSVGNGILAPGNV